MRHLLAGIRHTIRTLGAGTIRFYWVFEGVLMGDSGILLAQYDGPPLGGIQCTKVEFPTGV